MIYFDYAATSPIHPEIRASYNQLMDRHFANNQSAYDLGVTLNQLLEKSRRLSHGLLALGVNQEILFTSGATESNNLAIKGVALANKEKGRHLIVSSVEHASVLQSMVQLRDRFGFDLTIIPVNNQGIVDPKDLVNALRPDTILVSIMAVNNELGTIFPSKLYQALIRQHSQAYFHVDAVQALAKVDLPWHEFDLISLSAHKLGGLKGQGILIKRSSIDCLPLLSGGGQEGGLRAGTADALGQILWPKTLRLALEHDQKELLSIKKHLIQGLSKMPGVHILSPQASSPGILSIAYPKFKSEVMMNYLNRHQIYVASQSTCNNRTKTRSHVLAAMGFSEAVQTSVLRLSFGPGNTLDQADEFLHVFKELDHYAIS